MRDRERVNETTKERKKIVLSIKEKRRLTKREKKIAKRQYLIDTKLIFNFSHLERVDIISICAAVCYFLLNILLLLLLFYYLLFNFLNIRTGLQCNIMNVQPFKCICSDMIFTCKRCD